MIRQQLHDKYAHREPRTTKNFVLDTIIINYHCNY